MLGKLFGRRSVERVESKDMIDAILDPPDNDLPGLTLRDEVILAVLIQDCQQAFSDCVDPADRHLIAGLW